VFKHTVSTPDWHEKNIAQKGFTLIELLVVIMILGILAGVVVIAVANLRDNAEENACETEAKQIKTAVSAWRVQTPPPANLNPTVAELDTGGYLDGVPAAPPTLGYGAGNVQGADPVTTGC
jgi:prepilin-type N-terminal cleavage/methylation domain-containing protein